MENNRTRFTSWPSLPRFVGYVAATCGIVVTFWLCWMLREVFLLAFGAIILAVIIRALADPLKRLTGMRDRWAVLVVVILLVALCGGMSWMFGHQLAAQMQGLSERVPRALATVRQTIESNGAGKFVLEKLSAVGSDTSLLGSAQKFAAITVGMVGHLLLMFFTGIYLATSPQQYVAAIVRVFPVRHREKIGSALGESGLALRKWLIGQIVSMTSVGTLTGLGLWAVGAPLPLALGVMAGLLEFIPIVGPMLAIIPGVLVAFSEGPQVALYAAIVYLAVQQVEGSVIMPLAQRWAVALPPAFGLLSLVAFSLLFGFLGVFFGSPLAVVAMVLLQRLYIQEGLEKKGLRPHPDVPLKVPK